MNLNHLVFGVYLAIVATVGILVSRKKEESDDYFLASRNLTWWIIGGSMIAANISTHHFIGMSGRGYEIGLAIASFEWIAAIALVLYGKFFLPYYLKSRITTMPEFLERRFSDKVRLAYAVISLIGYIVIELAVVLYTGSLAIREVFGLPLAWGLVILCVIGGGYAIYGGFKAVAYTDIIQVTVLILGGLTVTLLGLHKLGALSPEFGPSVVGGFKAIFIYIQKYWSIAYPSVCALFLAGFFYKRANARGSLIAIIAGPAWALLITLFEEARLMPSIPFLTTLVSDPVSDPQGHRVIPFLTRGLIDCLFAFAIIWCFRTRGETLPANAVVDRSFSPEVAAYMKTVPWCRSFGLWATLLVACVVALYIRFW